MADVLYDPKDFADEKYAEEYAQSFDRYAELRVRGKSRNMAMIEAFEFFKYNVDTSNLSQLALAAEVNPYVQRRFDALLRAKDVKRDLWPERLAVHKLLEIIEDPMTKDSTKLNAVNALNVFMGYVTLDDQTARRVGHTIRDFERLQAEQRPQPSPGLGVGGEAPKQRVH